MAAKFLATLVAAMFLFGCASSAGESGNVAPDNNGNKQVQQADGGSQAQGDASSSPETKAEQPDPCNVNMELVNGETKPLNVLIDGKSTWTCLKDVECQLRTGKINAGKKCVLVCPKVFSPTIDKVTFKSEGELEFTDLATGTCFRQTN